MRILRFIFFTIAATPLLAQDHWSFRAPQPVEPPKLESDWVVNPIDAFILAQLRESGLKPSAAAEKQALIRRLSLDLTGLPPKPDDLDRDPAQYALQLLDSPRYGERWAQHWLDVIRWAETVGFETNLERTNAWPYRDWVINALNADKPYDRFVFEQIAGDAVGEDAALGFLVAGPANLPGQIGRDEEAMRQARQDELDEVIRTVSQSLFGLTIGCARCHDHKFDPITAKDYYSMQAIFAGMNYGYRRWRGTENDAWTAQIPAAKEKAGALRTEMNALRAKHGLRPPLASVQTETFAPILAQSIRMRIDATIRSTTASLYEFEAWTKEKNVALASNGAKPSASSFALANQTRHFDNLVDGTVDKRQAFPWGSAKSGAAWIQIDFAQPATLEKVIWHEGSSTPVDYVIEVLQPRATEWKEVASPRDRMPREDDAREAKTVKIEGLSEEEVAQLMAQIGEVRAAYAELRRLTAGPQVYAASIKPEIDQTYLLRRGDPMQREAELKPATPAVLGVYDLEGDSEQARRVALAKHLTNPQNPLTARVIVNRVWQHHFGVGLVETPSDFGKMGREPTHPQLLDWLTLEFVKNGWSLKWLHKIIVNSATYQQSSQPNPDAEKIDADARLLWRFPPRRMEAEAIRDSILAVSGKLNLEMGGRGFDFFQQRGGLSDYRSKETFDESGWRRMIYAHKIRMQSVDIFGAFDCPDAGQMKPRRTRSITPLQSLSLMNSPFANRQAGFFAERVRQEAGDDPNKQLDHIFALAFARKPTDEERTQLTEFGAKHGLEQVCRVVFNTSEFVFLN